MNIPQNLDLYLLVGQSNMAGRGELTPQDKKPVPGIYIFDQENQWAHKGEPVHYDKPIAGVGPGFTFARHLLKKTPGRTIGLIPCAVGGTPQERWMPGADLYTNAVNRAHAALETGTLKAILWHQGEAESGNEELARAYAVNLAKIVEGFRKDLRAPGVPFIAGKLGEFLYTRQNRSLFAHLVNEQIELLPTLVSNSAVASSEGLGHKGDELHFDAKAAKQFGVRYAEAFLHLGKDLPSPPLVKLRSHPRLLVSETQWQALRKPPTHPLMRKAAAAVQNQADQYVSSRALEFDPALHNSLLLRAREMQRRILTLLVRWGQTNDPVYRMAAMEDVRDMANWEYWGWDLWREGNPDPSADFDLSYGENSTTLALAYDWLYKTLSDEERALFHKTAIQWSFRPFLSAMEPRGEKTPPGWWFKSSSNWNTVCAGGAGMLALAMLDELPEAVQVLNRVEVSITPYMTALESTGGGWAEGIGYWNYGHRYAFLYLLSHERATGKSHPLMKLSGTKLTLDFPFDFCPNSRPCGFGDVNTWQPIPFHYAAAARLKRLDLIAKLDSYFTRPFSASGEAWPAAAELLLFHPGKKQASTQRKQQVAKVYPQLDWGILADQLPDPHFYLSVRGGTTEVPHSHMDLTSFHCVVGRERLIDNITIDGGDEYLDTTFGSRRFDLFETSPPSKNVVLINGVGIIRPSTVLTTIMQGKGWRAIRMDAAEAMGIARGNFPAASFYSRLFLLLDDPAAIIIDRIVLPHSGRAEVRFHTFSEATVSGTLASIRGKRERLQLTFASSVPATLYRAEDALTKPDGKSTVIRWCTDTRTQTEITMASLLVPGARPAKLSLQSESELRVRIERGKQTRMLQISPDLKRIKLLGK